MAFLNPEVYRTLPLSEIARVEALMAQRYPTDYEVVYPSHERMHQVVSMVKESASARVASQRVDRQ